MSNLFIFTNERLEDVKPPAKGESSYRDKEEKGLMLRVSYGGVKTFYFYMSVKGKPKKVKIGNFPEVLVEEARKEFVQIKDNLRGKKRWYALKSETTFKFLLNKYVEDYGQHHIKREGLKTRIALLDRKFSHLYDTPISRITRDHIQEVFNKTSEEVGKRTANVLVVYIKAIFNKAIEWDLIDKNPAKGIKKHKEKSRERYITKEEMPRFIQVVSEYPDQVMKDFIVLALLTGQRKSNVLSMRWQDISFQNETWSIKETKNGDPHVVSLTQEAINILHERKRDIGRHAVWVFPSPSKSGSSTGHLQEPKKAWKKIITAAGLEDIRIHDLRRTCGSWMAIEGASQYIIGRMLGHKSPQSTAVYARLSNEPVKKCISRVSSLMLSTNN